MFVVGDKLGDRVNIRVAPLDEDKVPHAELFRPNQMQQLLGSQLSVLSLLVHKLVYFCRGLFSGRNVGEPLEYQLLNCAELPDLHTPVLSVFQDFLPLGPKSSNQFLAHKDSQ